MRLGSRCWTAAACIAVLALAGCGDDGGGGGGDDDAKAIEAVTVEALTTKDPAVRCERVVTTAFVRAVYGDVATCRKAETPKPDDRPPTGARVTGVKVDGDRATATVTLKGGESDGASGPFSYAREGDSWRVDEVSVAFLRAQLARALSRGEQFDEDDGPLADAAVRTCIDKRLQALDDRTFRELAYAAIADRDPTDAFLQAITECTSQAPAEGGVSLLRRQFEQGLRESLSKDGATASQTDCVVRRLRRSISEDEIVEQVRRGRDDVSGDLAAKAARAMAACR